MNLGCAMFQHPRGAIVLDATLILLTLGRIQDEKTDRLNFKKLFGSVWIHDYQRYLGFDGLRGAGRRS